MKMPAVQHLNMAGETVNFARDKVVAEKRDPCAFDAQLWLVKSQCVEFGRI